MSSKRERVLAKLKGPSSIRANRSKWNESSQRTSYGPDVYHSSTARCDVCRTVFGLSASSKKKWYEVWKMDIRSGPTRCDECQKELKRLNALAIGFQEQLRLSCTKDDLLAMRDTLVKLKRLAPNHFDVALYNRICKKLENKM